MATTSAIASSDRRMPRRRGSAASAASRRCRLVVLGDRAETVDASVAIAALDDARHADVERLGCGRAA